MSDEIRKNRKDQPEYDPDFDEPFGGDGDDLDLDTGKTNTGKTDSQKTDSQKTDPQKTDSQKTDPEKADSEKTRRPRRYLDETPDFDDPDSFSGDGPDLDSLEADGNGEDIDLDEESEDGGRKTSGTGKPRELNTADTIINPKQLKDEKEKKKKSKVKKIIGWILLEVITLAAIFTYGYFLRSWNLISRPEVNEENIENKNISLEKKKEMEQGYWTVAVFGVDGRSASDLVSKGLNSDVILIVNINQDTGEIRMCNVFRDTYLNISDSDSYRKINAAYCNGGPEQALAALNKNLDLNIKNYVTFNWKAVADGINILGGVDGIDISKAEFYYINAFITETVEVTGVGSWHLKEPGTQHLDGVQAVAYGRLRLMDSDFARTERQKKIIKACFDKAKQANFSVLNNIMVVCFPEVATNIDFNTVLGMAQNITKYEITASGGFPWQRSGSAVSSTGDVVVPATLESNVKYLHMFLFDDENYQPSNAVLRYSETIKEKTGIYKEGQVVEYVRTDGGLISKPKTTEAETEESLGGAEYVHETDENGNEIEYVRITIDENGNYIYPTDADGNTILPTDSRGNVLYPTDEYGNIIYETDAEGNTVNPTDAEGNTLTYPDSRPTELEEDGEREPGEASHGDDYNEAAGPGAQRQTSGNHQSKPDGPATTAANTEAYGPGNPGGMQESSSQSTGHPSETINGADGPGGSTSGTSGSSGSSVPGGSSGSSGSITPGGTDGPGSSSGSSGSSGNSSTGSNTPGGSSGSSSSSSGGTDGPGGSSSSSSSSTSGPGGSSGSASGNSSSSSSGSGSTSGPGGSSGSSSSSTSGPGSSGSASGSSSSSSSGSGGTSGPGGSSGSSSSSSGGTSGPGGSSSGSSSGGNTPGNAPG